MKGLYVQPGNNLNYKNSGSTTIPAGALIVMGIIAGVTACDIAPGETGVIATHGVFSFNKESAEITAGAAVYYNSEDDVITTSTDNGKEAGQKVEYAKVGVCIEEATINDTAVKVRLNC